MQSVQLDKHIRLLDSPGVVMATDLQSDEEVVLRNCVKVLVVAVVHVVAGVVGAVIRGGWSCCDVVFVVGVMVVVVGSFGGWWCYWCG